jgi:pyruvate kinase
VRKTKIIATLGPATDSYGKIISLIKAGVNIFRLNFSHGDMPYFSKLISSIKKARSRLDSPLAIMQDLQGPKIRVAGLKAAINVKRGDILEIRSSKSAARNQSIQIDFRNLYKYVKPGRKILINDGMVQLRVDDIKNRSILCKVTAGGEIAPRKGVNLPGIKLPVASLTLNDRKNLKFGLKNGVDIVCLSFVRDAKDMEVLNSLIKTKNRPLVIAKIEKPEALKEINSILDVSDGVMVARGDLAVEAGYRAVPAAQKKIIAQANAKGKLVIVATQML